MWRSLHLTNPIDHAWAVLKANEVVIDGVTYVPQVEEQEGYTLEEEPEQEPSWWDRMKTGMRN